MPPGAWARPAARNPPEVAVRTNTWSPGCCVVIPWVAASVQDSPSRLVQMAFCPVASQPRGPAASRVAAYPRRAWPPPGARTAASFQVAPPSAETKNCWRAA